MVMVNVDGGCSFLAAYRRANGTSLSAWSEGLQPSGAVLHSSREPYEINQSINPSLIQTLGP